MTSVVLRDKERIDDLTTNDLKIIQSKEVFSFSMDAVLLARFCTVPMTGRILDLCTGNGVVALLVSTRTKAQITGVEIQERLWDMAVRSVQLNKRTAQIRMEHADLRTYHEEVGYGQYDLITVNPPYLPVTIGEKNENDHQAIARHEMLCTLEEVIAASSRLVRTGGKVSLVHRPSRISELLSIMRKYRLEAKRIRFVHPRLQAEANMVLIEAIRDGKPDARLLPPLIVYEENGAYTQEIIDLYGGGVYEATNKL